MKLYRIYTENTKHQFKVRNAVARKFPGFTFLKGVGYWEGKREQSLVIEIVTDVDPEIIRSLAEKIRIVNEQKSVMLTCQDIEVDFIEPEKATLGDIIYGYPFPKVTEFKVKEE